MSSYINHLSSHVQCCLARTQYTNMSQTLYPSLKTNVEELKLWICHLVTCMHESFPSFHSKYAHAFTVDLNLWANSFRFTQLDSGIHHCSAELCWICNTQGWGSVNKKWVTDWIFAVCLVLVANNSSHVLHLRGPILHFEIKKACYKKHTNFNIVQNRKTAKIILV